MSGAPAGAQQLRVDADLAIEVDGVAAQISGHGDLVEVRTDRPLALARSLASISLPSVPQRSPRFIGDELARLGLRIEVTSPRGLVVAIGAPAKTQAPRPDRHTRVEPGPARVVASEVAHEAGHALQQRRGLVTTVLAVLAILVGVGIARRILRRQR